METALYMRVRGRVLGPYEPEKLQGLARRGQLSRMHELSTDGITWVRASSFPELFTGGQSELPALHSAGANVATDGANFGKDHAADGEYRMAPPSGSPPTMPGGVQTKWFYTSGGQQQGPVDFSDLQMLVGLGQLSSQDTVWSEGMASWTPASQVHGLFRQGGVAETGQRTGVDGALPNSLCRSASDSRGWAIFIAIIMYLFSFSNVVFGILILIVGARERSAGAVANGIGFLVHALVIVMGGILLSTYASRLGSLRYAPEPIRLERALDALRNFWIFAGMYLIVSLAFVVIGAIAVFAYGVTLPHLSL